LSVIPERKSEVVAMIEENGVENVKQAKKDTK
jgi:hypothetical protein